MVIFSKYKFYNKLLDGVTLLTVTSGVTWTQPYIYIHIHSNFLENFFFFNLKNLIKKIGTLSGKPLTSNKS